MTTLCDRHVFATRFSSVETLPKLEYANLWTMSYLRTLASNVGHYTVGSVYLVVALVSLGRETKE